MANFITILSKLTSSTDYSFWEICIKSTLTFIIYSRTVFTTNNILNALALSQTTDINKIARKNFLGFQALAVLNSTFLDNLLMYGQPDTEALWAHFWTLMETSGPVSIFADY